MIIKINKIFGKYDTEINLDKKCTIFIGENGIGKSTSINILNKLLKFDYIGLLNYYFDSIEIKNNNEIVVLKYSDLMINNNDVFLMNYINDKDAFLIYKTVKERYELMYEKDIDPFTFDDVLRDTDSNSYWSFPEHFSTYYSFELRLHEIDNRLLFKILKHNDQLLKNEKLLKFNNRIRDNVSQMLDCIRNTYELISNDFYRKYDNEGIYLFKKYFSMCNVGKIHDKIKEIFGNIGYKDVYLIDMVSNFVVLNDLNGRIFAFNELESDEYDEMDDDLPTFDDKYKDIIYCNRLKNNYRMDDVGDWKIHNKNSTQLLFENVLFKNVYTEKMQEEFKNDFYNYLNEYKITSDKKRYEITPEIYNLLYIYLRPLLSPGNIIREVFNNTSLLDESSIIEYSDEFNFMISFYNKFKDKYFNIKNEKLEILNLLFNKYFNNKEIVATPFGICISTSKLENDIDFDELSTGEKKIIILFMLVVFSENEIILLDEPETSLNIIWQQDLIPDLLKYANIKNIIVATQSPYITTDDSLTESIYPIIIEGDNNYE